MKHNDKFRRFTVRGIQNAKAQWSMICSVKNLQKMYAIWTRGEIKFS
ncbi:MAG: transposase [Ignavibacteria bacterium]|nr:transposase [Ignavibacteria bacterium]